MSSDDAADLITERLIALGQVIEWSASMESTLRSAFCALVGSKFAAVVAGGQSADWLIGQCRALAEAHKELPADTRQAIKDALGLCEAANRRRNVLVHGVKTGSRVPDGALRTIRSRRNTHVPDVETWTPAEIREAAGALVSAAGTLFAAVQGAVSPEIMVIDDALAWEDRRRHEEGAQ